VEPWIIGADYGQKRIHLMTALKDNSPTLRMLSSFEPVISPTPGVLDSVPGQGAGKLANVESKVSTRGLADLGGPQSFCW